MTIIATDAVVTDDKFIVFKRDQMENWLGWLKDMMTNGPSSLDEPYLQMPDELTDAVVIRTQEVFAGPALHSYAADVAVAIHMIRHAAPWLDVTGLQSIADYFSSRAVEADEGPRKIPD